MKNYSYVLLISAYTTCDTYMHYYFKYDMVNTYDY
jgi:hypothetical protein